MDRTTLHIILGSLDSQLQVRIDWLFGDYLPSASKAYSESRFPTVPISARKPLEIDQLA